MALSIFYGEPHKLICNLHLKAKVGAGFQATLKPPRILGEFLNLMNMVRATKGFKSKTNYCLKESEYETLL